jgi:hypothetical protein
MAVRKAAKSGTVLERVEKALGRIETQGDGLSTEMNGLEPKPQWAGLWAVGRVESIRRVGDKTRTQCRPDLSRLLFGNTET